MTLYDLKPRFQALLRPLVLRLYEAGVTANQVTLAAAAGSLAVGGLILALGAAPLAFLLVPGWMLLRMALNAIDGMLAREFGQQSRLGAYLNELSDVVSDAALYAPFALLPPFGPASVGLVILLAVVAEYAGVLGPMVGARRRYDGPLGKSDRALVFGLLGAWAAIGGGLPAWLGWVMPVLAAALILTTVNRIRAGLREGEGA
jgi:CDP-diacylglycerol--glycerol-3-phosphate 3-phosphatidyltransferase